MTVPASSQPVTKLVFENLRQMFTCVALAVGGVCVMAFSELSVLGAWAIPLGILVIVVSAGLLVWNAISGARELARDIPVRSVRFWLVCAPAFALYAVLSLTIYGSVVKAQTEQFRDAAAEAAGKAASAASSLPKRQK